MFCKSMLAGFLAIAGTLASAATLTPTTPNSLALTVLSLNADSTVLGYDLRGTLGGNVDALGGIFISDGTALGLPAPAIPNISLLVLDAALDQSGLLLFGTPAQGGPGIVENATFTPNTPITDPALLAFVGSSPLEFDWSLTGSQAGPPQGDLPTTLSTWQLVDATSSTPEPASLALVGVGVLCIGLIRKKHSPKRSV